MCRKAKEDAKGEGGGMSVETFTRDDWEASHQQIKNERQERLKRALNDISPGPWELSGDHIRTKKDRFIVCEAIQWPGDGRLIESSLDLLKASLALLDRIDNISTEDFGRGGERAEREELRAVIARILGIPAEEI